MVHRLTQYLCCLWLGWAAATSQAEELVLNAAVSETNTAPYAMFSPSGQLTGGLAKDLLDQLALKLDAKVKYLNLPRGRVTDWLMDGQADIGCFLSPDWVRVEGLAWTPVLYQTRQLIVRRKGAAKITSALDLRHKRVGTTRGFIYPELTQLFSSGQAIRDDAASLQSNLQRLKQGRVDVVMTVDLSYGYLQQTMPDPELAVDWLWAEPAAVYCGLNSARPERVSAIQAALQRMQQQGEIELLLKKWGRYSPIL